MPLIRYRTGDLAIITNGEVSEVVGRDYEFLISATGRRISLTAINMHDNIFDGLLAVQFFQERPGEVECRLQPGPQWHSSREEAMRAGLLKKLGDDFTLTLHEVKEVEKTSAGKHKWLVTRVGMQPLAS
jgi:phenylacetate-CoA ligase